MCVGRSGGRDERRKWADDQFDELEAREIEKLSAELASGRRLEPRFARGELRLLADGAPVLRDIFLSDAAGPLTEAYWRWLLLDREWTDADAFAKALRRPPAEVVSTAADQFIERVDALARLADDLDGEEG